MSFKLGECGGDFHAKWGSQFYGAKRISVGAGVRIGSRSDFYVSPRGSEDKYPLRIGDGVHIGHRCTFACINSVVIENKVMIGNDVYVADHGHEYRDPDVPIINQSVTEAKPTRVESGSWIGAFAIIMPGVTIGKHSVVGAGAVVTKSVEPYTVVAGNPAQLIRRYDSEVKEWVRFKSKN